MTVRSTVGGKGRPLPSCCRSTKKGERLVNKENQVLFVDDEESMLTVFSGCSSRNITGLSRQRIMNTPEKRLLKKIKIIVCDHRMPVMLGVKFLQEVKADPDVIRILLPAMPIFQ